MYAIDFAWLRASKLSKPSLSMKEYISIYLGIQKTLTVLADPVEVVKVAAHVVPQPSAASVEDDAVLLPVVIIWLVLAPSRLGNYLPCR